MRRNNMALAACRPIGFLVLAAATFGCGGGPDEGVASLSDGEGASEVVPDGGGGAADHSAADDAMVEYARCMRDEGVDMPDPGPGGEGAGTQGSNVSPEAYERADEACRSILEGAAGVLDLSPAEEAAMQDQLVAVAECMRGRGYDMADPQPSAEGGFVLDGGEGEAAGDEQWRHDMEQCSEEAGMNGRGEAPSEDGE